MPEIRAPPVRHKICGCAVTPTAGPAPKSRKALCTPTKSLQIAYKNTHLAKHIPKQLPAWGGAGCCPPKLARVPANQTPDSYCT